MNKVIIVLGLIIIILGVGLSLGSNTSRNNFLEDVVAEVEDQWTISGEFHADENLTLSFSPSHDWSLLPYPDLGEPEYSKHFLVNITHKASGNYTSFKVVLAVPRDMIPPAPDYNFLLTIYDIEVTHHGALAVDDRPFEVRGIVKSDGEYSVKCELMPPTVIDKHLVNQTVWIHDAFPPPQLMLRRVKADTIQPYSFLLPTGIVIATAGCIVSIWGVRRQPTSKRRIKRRRSITRMHSYPRLH